MDKVLDNADYLFLNYSMDFRFDLQLFAAEDEGRTEEPTEYKKRRARDEGKVVKTPELPSALVLLFGFFFIYLFSKNMFRNSMQMMEYYFGLISVVAQSSENVLFLLKPILPIMLRIIAPVLGVVVIAAFAGNVMQVGLRFSTKPIQPDFSKINPNPVRFITKMLFSRQSVMNLGKSVFKIATISVVAFFLVKKDLFWIMKTMDMGVLQAFQLCLLLAFKLIMVVSGLLLILAIPDYFFQRREHTESLKMTRQELKEERKLLEGDPLLRARMRERQKSYAKRRMIQEVPKADVVITNPVHFAVALKYEPLRMGAPECVAKGQDLIAQRIKKIAEENDVSVVENKPLARELYKRVDIGDEVPEDLFTAVAEIIAFVYKLKQKEAVNV
ncbi:MAG TPA: flagellar biosynthesis protein FlhB [Spirochaetes bacterium]|nr:flagellar biosynthesis protein FlhB [Spirochaetota bacterium]